MRNLQPWPPAVDLTPPASGKRKRTNTWKACMKYSTLRRSTRRHVPIQAPTGQYRPLEMEVLKECRSAAAGEWRNALAASTGESSERCTCMALLHIARCDPTRQLIEELAFPPAVPQAQNTHVGSHPGGHSTHCAAAVSSVLTPAGEACQGQALQVLRALHRRQGSSGSSRLPPSRWAGRWRRNQHRSWQRRRRRRCAAARR